jgi:hypothetical protein
MVRNFGGALFRNARSTDRLLRLRRLQCVLESPFPNAFALDISGVHCGRKVNSAKDTGRSIFPRCFREAPQWIGERTRPRVHLSSVPLDMPTLVYAGAQGRLQRVGDVFAYGVMPLNDDARSWAIPNFYGIIEFFTRTARPN